MLKVATAASTQLASEKYYFLMGSPQTAYCTFNGTYKVTKWGWSQLFVLGFHITLMCWGHFLRVYTAKSIVKIAVLKILLYGSQVQKVVTTLMWSLCGSNWWCNIPFVVNCSKSNIFYWPAVNCKYIWKVNPANSRYVPCHKKRAPLVCCVFLHEGASTDPKLLKGGEWPEVIHVRPLADFGLVDITSGH